MKIFLGLLGTAIWVGTLVAVLTTNLYQFKETVLSLLSVACIFYFLSWLFQIKSNCRGNAKSEGGKA